jgi:hypothetical protein
VRWWMSGAATGDLVRWRSSLPFSPLAHTTTWRSRGDQRGLVLPSRQSSSSLACLDGEGGTAPAFGRASPEIMARACTHWGRGACPGDEARRAIGREGATSWRRAVQTEEVVSRRRRRMVVAGGLGGDGFASAVCIRLLEITFFTWLRNVLCAMQTSKCPSNFAFWQSYFGNCYFSPTLEGALGRQGRASIL